MATAQRLIEHYIAHRLERERLIEATLETPQRVEDIVANVYSDTPKEVWHLAAKNVEAHLQRLCELGRAERNENLYIRRQ